MTPNLLVLLGPTASGKTRLAVDAARNLNGEILSADSRQVYRGLDIGSGKDLAEYGSVPYHLIDIAEPGDNFNLFTFLQAFTTAYEGIRHRNRLPILVGGTGLYLDAVLRGYSLTEAPQNLPLRKQLASTSLPDLQKRLITLRPKQHNTTDLSDPDRLIRAIEIALAEESQSAKTLSLPKLQPIVFGLKWPRNQLRHRITKRLQERLAHGMIEEVESLHRRGVSWATLEGFGLEYRFVAQYLQLHFNRNDLMQKLNSAIFQFAKRQETWFRRMERQGVTIHWLEAQKSPLQELLQLWLKMNDGCCAP
ncbi:MAG: tRNA (adenosine(37)-N6)-dimethylallyltransferase MiaA [Deltaproteobacteria bacterium]|nr:tRNA (adenosine(37)-N6)-dimethylallyltransferase MiaA [Deltaproteobacteria bacterium]